MIQLSFEASCSFWHHISPGAQAKGSDVSILQNNGDQADISPELDVVTDTKKKRAKLTDSSTLELRCSCYSHLPFFIIQGQLMTFFSDATFCMMHAGDGNLSTTYNKRDDSMWSACLEGWQKRSIFQSILEARASSKLSPFPIWTCLIVVKE